MEFPAVDKKEGSHFRIFICPDKVIKQKKTVEEIAQTLKYRYPFWNVRRIIAKAKEKQQERDSSLQTVRNASIDKRFLADLEFVGSGKEHDSVEVQYQDRSYTVENGVIQTRFYTLPRFIRYHLRNNRRAEALEKVEEFVNYHRELWMRRLFEQSFNLAENYGVDKEGQLRAMGLSRFTSNRERALQQVRDGVFLKDEAIKPLQKRPAMRQLRPRFVQNCAKEIRPEVFAELWPA